MNFLINQSLIEEIFNYLFDSFLSALYQLCDLKPSLYQ